MTVRVWMSYDLRNPRDWELEMMGGALLRREVMKSEDGAVHVSLFHGHGSPPLEVGSTQTPPHIQKTNNNIVFGLP